MEKRRISILGDSISTFAGYTPEEAVFYDSYVQWETGVKSVEDTWWMQVIKALDGELGTNHSLAGSMVSGNLSTSAMSYERIEKLGANGIPDIILISAGCNDWGFCVLPEEFEEAYRTMLHRIKNNIHTQISIVRHFQKENSRRGDIFNIDSTISKRVYSDIIRECPKSASIYCDLANVQEEYETVDGVHPNKAGMHTLARMWIGK